MDRPCLYGASYSVYVRIVRLVLAEKHVEYDQEPVDIFAEVVPADYLKLQPFARIPAFKHGNFRLFETAAITRYVDESFPGPSLQPDDVRRRARMSQIIAVLDSYAYRPMVWDVFVERTQADLPDEGRIRSGLQASHKCLEVLQDLKGDHRWLTGKELSLADLHFAPVIDYFLKTAEGRDVLDGFPELADWWESLRLRESCRKVLGTEPV